MTQGDNTIAQDNVYDELLNLYLDVAQRYYLITGHHFHIEKERLDWWNRYQLARMRPA